MATIDVKKVVANTRTRMYRKLVDGTKWARPNNIVTIVSFMNQGCFT